MVYFLWMSKSLKLLKCSCPSQSAKLKNYDFNGSSVFLFFWNKILSTSFQSIERHFYNKQQLTRVNGIFSNNF